MKRVIHWFRRDLRISDNTALDSLFPRYADGVSTGSPRTMNDFYARVYLRRYDSGKTPEFGDRIKVVVRIPEEVAKSLVENAPSIFVDTVRQRVRSAAIKTVGSADSSSRRWGDFRAGCDDAARAPGSDRTSEMTTEPKDGLPNRQGSEKEPLMKIDSIYWENLSQHESETLRTWLGMTWAEDCEAKPKLPWIDSTSLKKPAREKHLASKMS